MCPLCQREVALTKHHVKLRRRGKQKLYICFPCQQIIHGLYPGTQLGRRPDLWTIEGLLKDEAILRALSFVKKLPVTSTMKMKERR